MQTAAFKLTEQGSIVQKKKIGRPRRDGTGSTSQSAIDYRTVLSLMPGKMMVRRFMDRELAEIKEGVRSGRNRGWLALVPGLEIELARINEDLRLMAGIAGVEFGAEGADGADREAEGEAEGDAEPLEDEGEAVGEPEPRQIAAAGGKSVDIGSMFEGNTTLYNKNPVMHAVVLNELLKHGSLDRKAFIEAWSDTYPTLRWSGGMAGALAKLKRAGIKYETADGILRLKSRLTGSFPRDIAEHPFIRGKAAETAKPQPTAPPESKTAPPEGKNHKFEGTQTQILLAEFHNSPDKTLNFTDLAQKYKTKPFTFNWVMAQLKKDFDYKFKQTGKGTFQMVKEGKTPRFKQPPQKRTAAK